MKPHFTIFLFALFILSCEKNNQLKVKELGADEPAESIERSTSAKTDLNAVHPLDYLGLYKGVLPCADCEGIETTISLEKGYKYTKRVKYLGKNDAEWVETKGKYTWNASNNTIQLEAIEQSPNRYFVGKNELIQLDMAGKRIVGGLAEKYKLRK